MLPGLNGGSFAGRSVVISLELDEEQSLIRETARRFAAERLFPALRTTEAERALAETAVRESAELGLATLDLPESAGGQGLGLLARCLVEEELAWGDPAACWALPGPGALGPFIRALGDNAQVAEVLGRFGADDGAGRRGAVAFSEARPAEREGLGTRARREGDDWVLEGDKAFVVNGGIADRYVVIAQVDPDAGYRGLGAFVVAGDAEGLDAGPRKKLLGLDAAHVADLHLRGVRVPDAARLRGGDDFDSALVHAFAHHALIVAARAVGLAQRAFELTRDYCRDRKAFGKPIAHFQAVAFTIADRLIDVDGARLLLWRAASRWDRHGAPDLPDVAAAAAEAFEAALRAGDDGVQLHGGAGFMRDYPIEKLLRDARQLTLMAPSLAVLDALAADRELGRPLDPAALLPTPDIQPILL